VKIRRRGQECNINIRDRGPKDQLRLRRTSSRNYRTPMQLEEENRIVSSTIELQYVIYWTFWKVPPSPNRKKELRTVWGPEALKQRSLEYKKQIKMDWYTEKDCTSSRNRSRRTVLRREQRNSWRTTTTKIEPLKNSESSWRSTTTKTGPQTRREETDCYTPLGHSGRIALRREQCDVFDRRPSLLCNTLVITK
jgi:hypothetical protein